MSFMKENISLAFGLYFMLTAAYASNYGAYNVYPQGSTRAVGMGGGLTALSDDASGILFNPAGLAFGKASFSIDGSNNPVENTELGTAFTNNSTFQFAAALIRFGDWGLGLGMSSPYVFKGESSTFDPITFQARTLEFEVSVVSGDIVLAKKFDRGFSIGVAGHYEMATEKLVERDGAGTAVSGHKENETNIYPVVGLSFRGNNYGFGVSYTPLRKIDFDENADSNIGTRTFYRDIEAPEKFTVGFFYNVNRKLMVSVDLDKIGPPKNSILVGTGITGNSSDTSGDEVAYAESEVSILHGGIEYKFVESNANDVTFRIGAYNEPSRVVSSTFSFTDTV